MDRRGSVHHVYLDGDRPGESLVLDHGWEINNSGKLVLFDPVYRDSVSFQQRIVNGIPVVSPLQLVLDLWHHPVRGRHVARPLPVAPPAGRELVDR